MNKFLFLLLLCPVLLCCSKEEPVLITDQGLKNEINERLAQRAGVVPMISEIEGLTVVEREALSFLYAYMPIGDIGQYNTEFFLSNIEPTLSARDAMPWADSVSERDFLHFILPLRVNNESLDTSRRVFYAELKERVEGLSMKDAILEVNHWCHEKVVYTPSDSRSLSPLATLCNAGGRCGEQSVFTVAALRAVGIPARQIYVPRWAHTDDNHAWVEAWATDENGVNGEWYYIGACEPEPVLNTGWFDASATRSSLMAAKVFGNYNDGYDVLDSTQCYTDINVTSNYAPTSRGVVSVVDSLGSVVEGADVYFTLYNYGEFYPIATYKTNSEGVVTLDAGLGDLVVFASKKGLTASGVLDLRSNDTLSLELVELSSEVQEWDIIPPVESPVEIKVSKEQRELNNIRFAREDSIRAAYEATFITKEKAFEIALEMGLDSSRVYDVLVKSRGNHFEISSFLLSTARQNAEWALVLLEVLTVKDLRDTPSATLFDHLVGALPYSEHPYFEEYILNPRIDNEKITPYRSLLSGLDYFVSAEELVEYVSDIELDSAMNPAGLAIEPSGVNKLKLSDAKSRERYLVALLRSKGFAAYREQSTGVVRYYDQPTQSWIYADLQGDTINSVLNFGTLKVNYTPTSLNDAPKLNLHFTIAKWSGSRYETVNIGESLARKGVDMGVGASFEQLFEEALELPVGRYALVTGTRLSNGTVLSRMEPFIIEQDTKTELDMVIRVADNSLEVFDDINVSTPLVAAGDSTSSTLMSLTGRGYFIMALIDAKKEPTTHLLRDLNKQKEVLEAWGRPVVLMLRDKAQMELFNTETYDALPSTVKFAYDSDGKSAAMLEDMLEIKDISRLPVVVVADTFGRVVYISTGYNTSLGEQLKIIVELL